MTEAEVLAAWHRVRGSLFTMVKDAEVIAFAQELGIEVGLGLDDSLEESWCKCPDGPYFGAQMAGTPLRCEQCGRDETQVAS